MREESPQLSSVERTADRLRIGVLLKPPGSFSPDHARQVVGCFPRQLDVRERPSTVFIFVAQCRQHAPVDVSPASVRYARKAQVAVRHPEGALVGAEATNVLLEGEGCVSWRVGPCGRPRR